MASYAGWLGDGPELRVLRLLGLFDRPAEAAALDAVRAAPEIPGLTEGLGVDDEVAWRKALSRLREARLVLTSADDGTLDAHPLVREYFGERLREESAGGVAGGARAALRALPSRRTDELPDTLEGLMPLYAAVVHGCRAGRVQEAFDEVYFRRIRRGAEAFSWKKLGAFGAELTALAAFFDRPWDRPSDQLRRAGSGVDPERGRLRPARPGTAAGGRPADAGGVGSTQSPRRTGRKPALNAGNLSELTLTLGEVASAVAAGEESVELADRSEDAFQRMVNRTTLADALHQAGRWEASASSFREAEAMQAEMAAAVSAALLAPGLPILRSAAGPCGAGGRVGLGGGGGAAARGVRRGAGTGH